VLLQHHPERAHPSHANAFTVSGSAARCCQDDPAADAREERVSEIAHGLLSLPAADAAEDREPQQDEQQRRHRNCCFTCSMSALICIR
jgi:hypothetical protein